MIRRVFSARAADTLRGAEGHRVEPQAPRTAASDDLERALAFALGAGIPAYLALRGGGYDIVVREEVGLVLWWSLALGLAFGVLPRSHLPRSARMPLAALAALTAWTALGLVGTDSAERTFAELARTVTLAGVVLFALCGLGARSWRAAAAGLSIAAVGLPVLAVLSRVAPSAFPGTADLGVDRLLYPLDYWNAVAAWSAMAIAIALGASSHLRRAGLRSACLAVVPVAGLALYLTYSRAGVIDAAIAVAVVLALGPQRRTAATHALVAAVATAGVILVVRGQDAIAEGTGGEGGAVVAIALACACALCSGAAALTGRRESGRSATPAWSARAAVIGIVAVAAVGTISLGTSVVSQRGEQLASSAATAALDDPAARLTNLDGVRGEVWSSALDAFASDPLRGIGPGTFDLWWDREGRAEEPLRDAHSLYLETLAELGLPGLILLLAFLGGLLAALLRAHLATRGADSSAATAGLIGAYVVFLFHAGVDWMWESTAVATLALGAAAIVVSASSSPRPPAGWSSPVRAGAIGLALLAGAVQVPGIVSTERTRASAAELATGDVQTAVELASDAIAAEPWAAAPYAARATAALSAGRLEEARSDALEAIDRDPTDWRLPLLLALIEARSGDRPAASAALDEVERLRPAGADRLERLREALADGELSRVRRR